MFFMRLQKYCFNALSIVGFATAQVDYGTIDFNQPPQCVSGVQVITSCGTYQTGYGTLDALTTQIVDSIPGSAAIALDYPANESPYTGSVDDGTNGLVDYIKYYVDGCPNVKLVLLGYSQGAQVTFNAVCGWPANGPDTNPQVFESLSGLSSKYAEPIQAIVAYGDPTHVYPQSFDRGTSTHNGEFDRGTGPCTPYNNRIASWCDEGDPFCDNCPIPANAAVPNPRGCALAIHLNYWNVYDQNAASFVLQQYHTPPARLVIPSSTTVATVTSTRTSTATTTFTGLTTSVVDTTTSTGRSTTSTGRSTSTGVATTTGTTTSTGTSTITSLAAAPTAPTSGASRLKPWLPPPILPLNLLRVQ